MAFRVLAWLRWLRFDLSILGPKTPHFGNGPITNEGVIAPGLSPGKLTIAGNYVQTATGRLDVEIGGLTPETQHDQLEVAGEVTMAGMLNLVFRDGFAPRMGDQVTLLSAGGALSTQGLEVNIVNLAPGFEYDLMLSSGAMTLVAKNDAVFIPEPTMLPMLAAVLIGHPRRNQKRHRALNVAGSLRKRLRIVLRFSGDA